MLFGSFRPYFLNLNRITAPVASYADFVRQAAHNSGNSYIGDTVVKHLSPKKPVRGVNNIFTDALDDAALEEAKHSSHIILVLQDQIKEHISYFENVPWVALREFIQRAKKLVVVFSLGANAPESFDGKNLNIDPDFLATLRVIADHSVSLGVRGDFTAEVLASFGIKNASSIGCPSFFFMGKNRRVHKKPRLGPDDKIVFNGVFSNLAVKNFEYVLQDEPFFLRLLIEPQLVQTEDFEYVKGLGPHYIKQITESILADRIIAHLDFRQAIRYYRSADFAIGTRLHGSIASLNAGVPTVLTNGDLRARGTAEFFKIPYRPDLGFSSNPQFGNQADVYKLFEEIDLEPMNAIYDERYENYKRFFKRCGLPYYGDAAPAETDLAKPGIPSLTANAQAKSRMMDILIESKAA
jgi:hypothetical protein